MAKKRAAISPGVRTLYREIRAVLEGARASAYRTVNAAMVRAYWQVGRLIVEYQQGGRKRAAYGEAVLDDLSQRLTTDLGRGFDVRNLRYMRQFYLVFSMERALPTDIDAKENGTQCVPNRTRRENGTQRVQNCRFINRRMMKPRQLCSVSLPR